MQHQVTEEDLRTTIHQVTEALGQIEEAIGRCKDTISMQGIIGETVARLMESEMKRLQRTWELLNEALEALNRILIIITGY